MECMKIFKAPISLNLAVYILTECKECLMQEKYKFWYFLFSRIKPVLHKFSTILYYVLDTSLLS